MSDQVASTSGEPQSFALEILLVEGDRDDAEACIDNLKQHNLANNIHWVKDGVEALDFVSCTGEYTGLVHAPTMILLDPRLPRMGGLDVIRKLRCDDDTRLIPIIILTPSNEDDPIVGEAYKLGANGSLAKPVEFYAFTAEMARLGLSWLIVDRQPLLAA